MNLLKNYLWKQSNSLLSKYGMTWLRISLFVKDSHESCCITEPIEPMAYGKGSYARGHPQDNVKCHFSHYVGNSHKQIAWSTAMELMWHDHSFENTVLQAKIFAPIFRELFGILIELQNNVGCKLQLTDEIFKKSLSRPSSSKTFCVRPFSMQFMICAKYGLLVEKVMTIKR